MVCPASIAMLPEEHECQIVCACALTLTPHCTDKGNERAPGTWVIKHGPFCFEPRESSNHVGCAVDGQTSLCIGCVDLSRSDRIRRLRMGRLRDRLQVIHIALGLGGLEAASGTLLHARANTA
jgi:hypothetical protein